MIKYPYATTGSLPDAAHFVGARFEIVLIRKMMQ